MLDKKSDIGEAWNNLGVAYREIGNHDEAMSSFRAAVMFSPKMAEAWNNLGVAQDEFNLTEKALKSYTKAIEIQPNYASAHLKPRNFTSKIQPIQGGRRTLQKGA